MFPDTFKDVPCVSPQEKAYQLDKTLEQLGYDPHAKPPSKATWALSVVFEKIGHALCWCGCRFWRWAQNLRVMCGQDLYALRGEKSDV